MAATLRGWVTPITLPSAAHPASRRYLGERDKGEEEKDIRRGRTDQWVTSLHFNTSPKLKMRER